MTEVENDQKMAPIEATTSLDTIQVDVKGLRRVPGSIPSAAWFILLVEVRFVIRTEYS